MLGIAKMQGLAMSSTTASRARALAAIQASSLAAAMQANRGYWASATSTPGTIKITTTANNVTFADANSAAMQSAITTVSNTPCTSLNTKVSCYCTGSPSPCLPTSNALALAASDLYDFGWGLAAFLPASLTTVSCNELDTPVDCTIAITWTENTVAMTSQQATQSANNGSTVPVAFTLYVVP